MGSPKAGRFIQVPMNVVKASVMIDDLMFRLYVGRGVGNFWLTVLIVLYDSSFDVPSAGTFGNLVIPYLCRPWETHRD